MKALDNEPEVKSEPKSYPGRPPVDGEHYAKWEWPGPGLVPDVGEFKPPIRHRHAFNSFPESAFADLEELGFVFKLWCAA